ncbi:MAG TPA: ABC transporter permease [Acidimicrobiia bacterium]|nr:ABC transporter permease [Acidimicrobiia bacterium]
MTSLFNYIADNFGQVVDLSLQHAVYMVSVMVAATIVGVGIGVWVQDKPVQKEIALGIASVFITLPSLALFTIFIPVVGLGFWSAFIALFMYALLPILRNTVTGLAEVSPAVLESARGMGLTKRERLWKIQLPLAWPVIITGIRVAALLTAGIAAIATLIAGGGLGDFIKDGLANFGFRLAVEKIWTGTLFIILLALIFDGILGLVRKYTTSPGIR